jgi:hypothetical protein
MTSAVVVFCRFSRAIAAVTEQHLRVVQLLLTAAMADASTPGVGGRGLTRGQGNGGAAGTGARDQQVSTSSRDRHVKHDVLHTCICLFWHFRAGNPLQFTAMINCQCAQCQSVAAGCSAAAGDKAWPHHAARQLYGGQAAAALSAHRSDTAGCDSLAVVMSAELLHILLQCTHRHYFDSHL